MYTCTTDPTVMTNTNLLASWASAIAVILGAWSASHAADWPQWQGPDRNAVSKETGLLKEWPAEGPPLARKITGLGGGDSAPAIADGRIVGMGNRGEKEVVWELAEADGKELWATPITATYSQRMPQSKEGPGCTPTVDGDLLYVITMDGTIACLQVADGKVVWQKSLTRDFGGRVPMWSYRESPLVDGDKVIVTPGAPDATLVALNKTTGELIWKSKASGDDRPDSGGDGAGRSRGRGFGFGGGSAAYASAIAIDVDGQRQYVQLTAKALVGVAASDGSLVWQYENAANSNGINCSTPIFHDGMVFAASAYGAGGGLVKLTKGDKDAIKAEEVWFSRRMQNHHGGMIVVDGCLYGANGGNGGGALICLDWKTGDVLWDQRSSRQAPKGSIALADGRLYYRTEEGTLLLIEPNREKYIELGRFEQPDRSNSPAWAHPVIANGKLYVRDQDELFCYDITAK
jgi:outer membrane protein assembly factor BamB